MSSGSLPLVSYHRASHLGEGSYGSVVTVYNDDGEEFALKLFLPEEDSDSDDDSSEEDEAHKPMEIGALREISCLRLIRGENKHENIVEIQDVQTDWNEEDDEGGGGGAGTSGCLGMALPLGKWGSLADNIAKSTFQGYPKKTKVGIAHGLLSAVAFLHDNGILHRDIKSDNVLLEHSPDIDEHQWKPVLIDFSLAKPIDGTIWGRCDLNDSLESMEHTGEVGTVVYTAPEIVNQEAYGKPADIYSVGVVLMELLRNQMFTAEKASHAACQIKEAVAQLNDSAPFPELIRSLLKENPSERFTARQALSHPVFAKFGWEEPPAEPRILNVATALPYDHVQEEEENEAPSSNDLKNGKTKSGTLTAKKNTNRQSKKLRQRLQKIDKFLHVLESQHPWTRAAAFDYSRQLEQLDESLDDTSCSQSLADCCVLAHRFFEMEVPDLDDLNECDTGVFAHWTLDDYVDNEATIFMMLDFCLYPRSLSCG